MIEIRQMKHILAVAKYSNFKRASESVFLSQPALSLSIKAAEEWFGQKLFERGKRKVVPTAFGEIVIELAVNTINSIEETMLKVKQVSGMEGSTLRINLSPICSEVIGNQLISKLVKHLPNNTFQINSNVVWESSVDGVKNNSVDIAVEMIAFEPRHVFYDEEAINYIGFDVPQLIYYCRKGHPITELDTISYNDVIKYPFVSQPLPPLFREWLIRATGLKNEADLEKQVVLISNDRRFLKTAVLNSNCLSGAIYYLIEKELDDNLVEILDIKWKIPPLINKGIIIFNSNKPLTPLVQKTKDIICELFNELNNMELKPNN